MHIVSAYVLCVYRSKSERSFCLSYPVPREHVRGQVIKFSNSNRQSSFDILSSAPEYHGYVRIYSKNHSKSQRQFVSYGPSYCDDEVHEELLSACLSFEMPYRNAGNRSVRRFCISRQRRRKHCKRPCISDATVS